MADDKKNIPDVASPTEAPAPTVEAATVPEPPAPEPALTDAEAVMTYQNDLADCISFSSESSKWGAIERGTYYTTNGTGWQESCDNNNGGIDVSWAFHLHANEVRAAAPQKFADAFSELLQLAIDNDDRDPDQLQAIVNLFA